MADKFESELEIELNKLKEKARASQEEGEREYNAGNYGKAANYFIESLKSVPTSRAYIKLALSQFYSGDKESAEGTIVYAIRRAENSSRQIENEETKSELLETLRIVTDNKYQKEEQ